MKDGAFVSADAWAWGDGCSEPAGHRAAVQLLSKIQLPDSGCPADFTSEDVYKRQYQMSL